MSPNKPFVIIRENEVPSCLVAIPKVLFRPSDPSVFFADMPFPGIYITERRALRDIGLDPETHLGLSFETGPDRKSTLDHFFRILGERILLAQVSRQTA